jgi:hypothetical protein
MTRVRLLALLTLPALGACTEGAGVPPVDARVEPAVLRFGARDAQVTVPEAVAAGATFTVVVGSIGGGCVREALAPVVRAVDGATEIALFNRHTGATVCTDDLLTIEHRVAVRATPQTPQAVGAGRLVLRIVGGARSAESGWEIVPLTVTRTVVVR